jgi:hypothetical protein
MAAIMKIISGMAIIMAAAWRINVSINGGENIMKAYQWRLLSAKIMAIASSNENRRGVMAAA